MILILSAGFGAILGVWCYLMYLIYQDAFAPEVKVEPREIQIGAWRKTAYTTEAICRREGARAHRMMAKAEEVANWGAIQLKRFDNRDLHRSINDLVRTSWPEKKTITFKVAIAA